MKSGGLRSILPVHVINKFQIDNGIFFGKNNLMTECYTISISQRRDHCDGWSLYHACLHGI